MVSLYVYILVLLLVPAVHLGIHVRTAFGFYRGDRFAACHIDGDTDSSLAVFRHVHLYVVEFFYKFCLPVHELRLEMYLVRNTLVEAEHAERGTHRAFRLRAGQVILFIQPELFCDFRFNHIMKEVSPPLIYTPLKIIPELQYFLNGSITYLKGDKVCRDLLSLKRKELAFVLGYYYSDYDLSSLVHPLSKYVNSFQYFVIQNYKKVKTVEELAQLGGYTLSTFRRIFNNVFHEPVYEWMLARRKEGILDDLNNSECSISEICYKYGFESLPHFSNFCKKSFGASPRNLRRQDIS